jgi:hypothetical protein
VLPGNARAAFWYGLILSALAGLTIITLVPALTGLSGKFGSTGHDGYWELATHLIRGEGYVVEPGGSPVLFRPPLVPALFSPLTLLPTGFQRPAVVLLQSLMVGAACFLLFDLAARIAGFRVARFAVAILLVYPWLYWHVKNPMNVVTQMLCVLAIVDLMTGELFAQGPADRSLNDRRWLTRAALLGLAGGAAMLTHGTVLLSFALLLAGVAGLGVLCRRWQWVAVAAIAGCVAAAIVAPWTYRNWTVAHRFVPIVTSAGTSYFWGNAHWEVRGAAGEQELEKLLELAGVPGRPGDVMHFGGLKDPKLNAVVDRRMAEHIRAHPARLAEKIARNALELYLPSTYDLLNRPSYATTTSLGQALERGVLSAWHLGLWGLALAGVWRIRRRRAALMPALVILGCVPALVGPYLPFLVHVGHSQYVLPTIPLLALLAGWTLAGSHSSGGLHREADASSELRSSPPRRPRRPTVSCDA